MNFNAGIYKSNEKYERKYRVFESYDLNINMLVTPFLLQILQNEH